MSIAIICYVVVGINVCSIFQIKAETISNDETDTEVAGENVEQGEEYLIYPSTTDWNV
ncbi:MAG: hypothetical protein NC307_06440 [Roseburia sp.]|nr:hypothetical protein [Roseburia sp.]